MKTLTVAQRLALGFAAVVAITATLGLMAFARLQSVSGAATYLATDPVPGTVTVLQIEARLMENASFAQMHINAADHGKYDALIAHNIEYIGQQIAAYEATIVEDADRQLFAQFKSAREEFVTAFKQVLVLSGAGKAREAEELVQAVLVPAHAKVTAVLAELVGFNLANLDRGVAAIQTASADGRQALVMGVVVALLAAVLVAWFSVRVINRRLVAIASSMADGSQQVTAAACQVSASSQTLAEGASEQAASLEETSSSLEEIASMTRRNAENAGQAKVLSAQTRTAADSGAAEMEGMQFAMAEIKTSAANIAKIVQSIDDIAFQTNILALNAAVEAARAGEAGAGFAVVADEVRALAQRSAQAAKETAEKIEDSVRKSDHGVQVSARVAQHFAEIVDKARKVDALVAEIATASTEQTQGIAQVNSAVSQMDAVTQSTAAGAEESAAVAEELNAHAIELTEVVGHLLALVDGPRPPEAGSQPATPFAEARRPRESSGETRLGATRRGARAAPPRVRGTPATPDANGRAHVDSSAFFED